MKFYWFDRHNNVNLKEFLSKIEDSGFDGMLLAYAQKGDPFTRLARDLDVKSSMEYIVAVRPWLMSPQYLSQIIKSMNEIKPNSVSINLVPGNILEDEKAYGGIIGSVNDLSDQQKRREYLNSFLESFSDINKDNVKIYVSGHHEDVYGAANKYADSFIMNYRVFEDFGRIKPTDKEFYISMSPVIGSTEGFEEKGWKITKDNVVTSSEGLKSIIKDLESSFNVKGILFHNTHSDQFLELCKFVKDYKK